MEQERRDGWASWVHPVVGLLGLYLALSTFFIPGLKDNTPSPQAVWNDVAVGGCLMATALWGAARTRSAAPHWFQVGLGGWLLVAPVALAYGYGNLGWNDMMVGVVVAMLGVIAALGKSANITGRITGS